MINIKRDLEIANDIHAPFEFQRNFTRSHVKELLDTLAEAVKVIEFYGNGGNSNRDIWIDENLGYFTGKKAREFLAKMKEGG